MADEKLIAPKHRRLAAFIADAILVFLLWYLMTMKDLGRVDTLLESLDPLTEGALDRLAESIFKMATAFLLKWLFCQSLYFCILPAVLGNGKTVGKLLFRLSLLDAVSLEEMSPSRLVFRTWMTLAFVCGLRPAVWKIPPVAGRSAACCCPCWVPSAFTLSKPVATMVSTISSSSEGSTPAPQMMLAECGSPMPRLALR